MTKREVAVKTMMVIILGSAERIKLSEVFEALEIEGEDQLPFMHSLIEKELYLYLSNGEDFVFSINHNFQAGHLQLMQVLVDDFGQGWNYPDGIEDFRQRIQSYFPRNAVYRADDGSLVLYPAYMPYEIGKALDWFKRIQVINNDFLGEFAGQDGNYFAKLFACPAIGSIFANPDSRERLSGFTDDRILAVHNYFAFSFENLSVEGVEFALRYLLPSN